MKARERILVMAHAHPDFSLGGGEIAAYNLYNAYRSDSAVEQAWFLGRAERGRGPTGMISKRRDGEYLWEQASRDLQYMKAVHADSVTTWFAELVRSLQPTIVHAHHYLNLGLEYLRVIKTVNPRIRVYITLHEFVAICQNNGQMIKAKSSQLCNRESIDECKQCFPEKTVTDFWLRKHYYLSHFGLVDGFIAPSDFLRQRYIEWGIDPARIVTIENGQGEEAALPPRELPEGGTRNRFGFFGQINPYKGLDVLLRAMHLMKESERQALVMEVHGANLDLQGAELREKIAALAEPLIEEGCLQWIGPYAPRDLRRRMGGIDWLVVPSIWWENSPMVIQEAFSCGRPVICSDIGGMREKVTHGRDGLHVPVGMPTEWRTTLLRAARQTTEWERLRDGIRQPAGHAEIAQRHLAWMSRDTPLELAEGSERADEAHPHESSVHVPA